MRLADFSIDVPGHLIAQYPQPTRSGSRLMVLDGATNSSQHGVFTDLPMLLEPGDLLVLNDTKVIPARLYGTKETGGKIEVMFERVLNNQEVLARIRASKSPMPGSVLFLQDKPDEPESEEQNGPPVTATVSRRDGEFFVLRFADGLDPLEVLHQQGRVPLPPYITRTPEPADAERYQTIYGRHPGAVAAPTAGLHFDEFVFESLALRGIDTASVTLHVGAGTFQPIRDSDIDKHVMHAEHVEVSADTVRKIRHTRETGGRVIAVGTTTVRSLETAANNGSLEPYAGDTRIFIKPGNAFNVVDGMITNFHLPDSTLILLVAAFAGCEQIMRAYREAVSLQYRFYSYGDAMLLWPDRDSWQTAAASEQRVDNRHAP